MAVPPTSVGPGLGRSGRPGEKVVGWPVHTIVNGDIVMSDQDITLHKRWYFESMKDSLMWRLAHDVSNAATPSAWGETTIGME